jgi:hypothetical protein
MESWLVLETYYKHGDYSIRNIKSLRSFLIDKCKEYEIKVQIDNMHIDDLIDIVIKEGNRRIEEQEGWGVREIINLLNMNL